MPVASDIATKANVASTRDLTTIMLTLGYTIGQVQTWDFLASYAEQLAVFYAFTMPPLSASEQAEKAMDCRADLRTLTAIVCNGTAVAPTPGASAVGGIVSGHLSAVDEARREWQWIDRAPRHRGRPS